MNTNSLPGIEPREPAYAWGQRVIALDDLVNDGSYPSGRWMRCWRHGARWVRSSTSATRLS